MCHQQDAAAGDEAICHIEYGKFHEGGFDHVHHIAQPYPVDHISQPPGVDGGDAPPLQLGKGHGLFIEFPENQPGENHKYHRKQPLLPLKGGEGCAGVLDIGQLQKPRNEGHIRKQLDIGHRQVFGELIRRHNCGNEKGIGQDGHRQEPPAGFFLAYDITVAGNCQTYPGIPGRISLYFPTALG